MAHLRGGQAWAISPSGRLSPRSVTGTSADRKDKYGGTIPPTPSRGTGRAAMTVFGTLPKETSARGGRPITSACTSRGRRAADTVSVLQCGLPTDRATSSGRSSPKYLARRARACSARASPARRRRPPAGAFATKLSFASMPSARAISFCSRSFSRSTLPSCVTWPGLTTASKMRASSSESSIRTWLRR